MLRVVVPEVWRNVRKKTGKQERGKHRGNLYIKGKSVERFFMFVLT